MFSWFSSPVFSPEICKKLQRFLMEKYDGEYGKELSKLTKPIDGKCGKITIKSFQKFLLEYPTNIGDMSMQDWNSEFKTPIDGEFGKQSIQLLQLFLVEQEKTGFYPPYL